MNNIDIDSEQFFCIIGILCIATDNYAYSKDKYPYDIYQYFSDILNNKKELLVLDNVDVKPDCNKTRVFVRSDITHIVYDIKHKHYFVNNKYNI